MKGSYMLVVSQRLLLTNLHKE